MCVLAFSCPNLAWNKEWTHNRPLSLYPPCFLPCQNSRKLGHRANKQWRPHSSPSTVGASRGTPALTVGVGSRARKLINITSQPDRPKRDTRMMHRRDLEGGVEGWRVERRKAWVLKSKRRKERWGGGWRGGFHKSYGLCYTA